ncbi:MAG TPA: M15 family metallopeptidase [Blastocatellia bacterium]|nr:M15 family metallopeptidase [Blastocatellia bacterium]
MFNDDRRASAASSAWPRNPFVGLRPFDSGESLLFFGRRQQTMELLQHLHRTRFLAVVGSSGCGKSSLIRAGLIPKLEAGFLVEERDRWHVAAMKPGDAPLQNLASALLEALSPGQGAADTAEFVEAIRVAGAQAIIDRLESPGTDSGANVLLLIDQFEEIFRFGLRTDNQEHRDEAADFVSIMLGLAKQSAAPIYVVMTMRSDFLGDCDNFYGLPEAMNRSQYLVPRLTRKQRQEAIEGPIRLFGATLTPRLLDRLLNDVGDQSDQLPVMQHALMRTWENWLQKNDGPVDTTHYEAIGTIKDALSKDADQALEGMSAEEVMIAERMFQALTDTDARNRRIRRPAYLSEIEMITGASRARVLSIIERFQSGGRSFLDVSEDKVKGDSLIDISHESLIRQWKTLRDWVDKESDSRATYMRVVDAAVRHKAKKAKLWGNPDLQIALDWREKTRPNKAWAERYSAEFETAMNFLNKSRRRRRIILASVLTLVALALFSLQTRYALSQRYRIAQLQEQHKDELEREDEEQKDELLKQRLREKAELVMESQKILDVADEFYEGKVLTYPHPVVGDITLRRLPDGRVEFLDNWVSRNIGPVDVPELREIVNPVAGRVLFNKKAATQLQKAFEEIKAHGLLDRVLTWDLAFVAPDDKAILELFRSSGPQPHSLGIAFDINRAYNPQDKAGATPGQKGSVSELIPIFERFGFVWGGERNAAHFQLTHIGAAKD